jgi:hypothetical protein
MMSYFVIVTFVWTTSQIWGKGTQGMAKIHHDFEFTQG